MIVNIIQRGEEKMSRFCTKCEAEIPEGSNFCIKCGAKYEDEQQVQKSPPESQPAPTTPPPAPTYTSKIKPPSKTMKYIGVIAVTIIIIIASLYVGFMMGDQDSTEYNDIVKDTDITKTTSVPVTSGSVGYSGGSINVSNSSSPLFGLNIDVPQAAADDTVNFDISYSDITGITGLPETASFASKMITIETDGNDIWDKYKSFEKPCTVTLPYDPSLVTNEESIRFYSYDDESGRFEATGFISQDIDANTITFYAGTFSNFTAIELSIASHELLGENYKVDTGFRPQTDGWFIANWGSYLRPGGMCLGMTSYAKWYYVHKKSTYGNLYTKYIEGDEDEWRDDETAIQLATRCQMGTCGIWRSLTDNEKAWAKTKSKDVAYSIIHGMIVSKEPQLIGLKTKYTNGTWASGGHAILAYKYSGGRFDIYDPNYPGTQPGTAIRQIPFTSVIGFTEAYTSGQTAASGRQYNVFYHAGLKTFSPLKVYKQLFEGAEKQFKDDSIFPEVKLTDSSTTPTGHTPLDIDADDIRDTTETQCRITGTITGGWKAVSSTLIFVSGQKFKVPVDYYGTFSKVVPLYAGENEIIILATDENTRTNWSGFLRESINSTASKTSFTLTLTWGQDQCDVDLHVLEPTFNGLAPRHVFPHGGQGKESGYPYMTVDNQDGYGPEQYIATENMTLPNYEGGGKSLYGTYKFRVHYMWDRDDDFNTTQPITWQVHLNLLAFYDSENETEYWEEKTWTGNLSTYSYLLFYAFDASGDAWSPIYEIPYTKPNPADYGISPPPQNELPN
jgi:uncharacterized protein YfaP (DUF2135 family)